MKGDDEWQVFVLTTNICIHHSIDNNEHPSKSQTKLFAKPNDMTNFNKKIHFNKFMI